MEKKHKFYATFLGVGIALFGIVLTNPGVTDFVLLARNRSKINSYSIELNESNKYNNGETTKSITTVSGAYQVNFSYYNCSSSNGYHAVINNEGTIKNADHIWSINYITADFTCSDSTLLKFRASYDGNKWGEYATLTSQTQFYLGDSQPYYIELKAFGGPVSLKKFNISYACSENPNAKGGDEVWSLVTSDDEVETNKEYVIVSIDKDLALSTTQNQNNRAATSIIKTNNGQNVEITDDVQILTILETDEKPYIAFSTGDGYLTAPGDGNYLRVSSEVDKDSKWGIWIEDDDHHAYIQSRTSGDKDRIFFNANNNNPIFSCYASNNTSMGLVNLYKKSGKALGKPLYPAYIDAVDELSSGYHVGDVFANSIGTESGLNVKMHYSDGTSKGLNISEFEYSVKTIGGTPIDPSKGFTSIGSYLVTIRDKSYGFTYTYQILVANNPVVSITLNTHERRGIVGDSLQLIATILPSYADDKSITWTSDKPEVASVNGSGLVYFASGGKAIITATANGGKGKTDSCVITVSTGQSTGGVTEVNENYQFSEINGFDKWANSYSYKEVEYNKGTIKFAAASHQGSNMNISDIPVTKGSPVEYVCNTDLTIKSFNFKARKWGNKSQTITLNTSTTYGVASTRDIGTNYTSTDIISSNFTLSHEFNENEGINAIKFTFSSSENQIGIEALDVVLYEKQEYVEPVTGISVTPATSIVYVGETTNVNATVFPATATNKGITWTSSDNSIATVNNGVVTGIKAGKATITATTKDGGFQGTSIVTVNNKPVTDISLNYNEADIYMGGNGLQLTATINSDATIKTITWTSSDTTVATVDASGKVSAVNEGVAIISATADGEKTATCTITVLPKQEGGGGGTGGETSGYRKVTSNSDLTDGQYLIVCEEQNVAFDGSHKKDGSIKLDDVENIIEISIESNQIESNTTTDAAAFTFKASTGSFKNTAGTYFGNDSDSNALSSGTSEMSNTVSITNSEDASIRSSGGSYLRYNSTDNQLRFRYYKSSTYSNQKAIQLYKLGSSGGGGGNNPPPVVKPTLSSIMLSGPKTSFTKGDTFVFGGTCTAIYSDESEKGVTPTSFSGYDMNKVGEQEVTVSYTEDGITQTATYKINVEDIIITLEDITVTPSAITFNTGDPFSKPTVTAKYSDGSTVNVTNSATISGYNANTSGKQTITVTYTEGGVTLTKTYIIEVIDPEAATTGSATIIPTDLQTSYPGSETTFTKSNMTFGYNTVANMNSAGYLQFKKQVGYIRNTVAIAGLRSIEVVVTSGKSFTGTLFSGTTSDDLTHSQEVEESGTYFIDSGDKFFKLAETGSTAGYLDSVTVNYSTKKVNPTSVYFDNEILDMTLGETAKLVAKFTPEDCNENMGLTWTSSNTGIATVSNGTITAKAKGSTTITATSTYNSNFKATCLVNVKDISVTSVELDTTATTLSLGSTQQLYATVKPTNATNQNVSWTSSNTSVATVSSTGLVTAKAVGTSTIKVITSDGNKSASCLVTVEEQKLDKWTILLYICGADLESDGGYASSDIKEILSTKNKPNDVNIVIQTGGTKSWELSSTYLSGATKIDATKTQRWHVEGSKLVLDETLNKANFGSSSTLQSFYTWGTSTYPAQKTGFIFWNHGGGVDGVCWDENYNDDCLSMYECKSALSGAFGSNPSKKLEWVGYDACLMQVQDIADYNSNYFNYMVASEESESGYGWDYDKWLPYVYNGSATSEVLKQICYTFIAEQGTSSDQTLSYLNLAYMQEYKTAWENFASALKSTLTTNKVSKKTFQTFVNNNVKYYSESGYCGWGNVDAKDLVNKVAANSSYNPGSTYTNAVLTAFSKLVEYSRCGSKAGNSYGLCCVYRVDRNVSYTSDESSFTNWISFNSSFGG